MMQFLTYLFWPNPGIVPYDSSKVLIALALSALLMVASVVIGAVRRKSHNAVFKKLSSSWAPASFWFGFCGAILTVSRAEGIQFLSMRFLWVLWAVFLLLYIFFMWRHFRARHYTVMPRQVVNDPRDAYLPKRKKK